MVEANKAQAAESAQVVEENTYTTLLQEEGEDSKTRKVAFGFAAFFHLGLLAITLPELYSEPQVEEKEKKIYVVQQIRFQPPPPKQKQEIPKPKAKKVPIPDPTPDEPEFIVIDMPEPKIEMPDMADMVLGFPDAPPIKEAMPTGPFQVGGDVVRPVKILWPSPEYTEFARKARIQGLVIVQAIIDKDGRVTDVKVLKGLPMGLDMEAVKAVKRWIYKPATRNGKPVAVVLNFSVTFRLQ